LPTLAGRSATKRKVSFDAAAMASASTPERSAAQHYYDEGEGWFVSKFGLFFVSKNVFCGVLWCFARVFCDILRVFYECFASVLQYFSTKHTKHTKNIEYTLENTKNSQYARVMRAFFSSEPQIATVLHKTDFTNICKTPQNTAKHSQIAKQSQNAFFEITSQNTANRTQNAQNQKRHKTLTIQPLCVLRACGVFSQNMVDLICRKSKSKSTQYVLSGQHDVSNMRRTTSTGLTRTRQR